VLEVRRSGFYSVLIKRPLSAMLTQAQVQATLKPESSYNVTVENKAVTKVAVDTQTAQTVRVKFDQLDQLMNLVGELVINKIALLQVTADGHHSDGLKRISGERHRPDVEFLCGSSAPLRSLRFSPNPA
jgi:chemotaxis protein histidine kinase CheA